MTEMGTLRIAPRLNALLTRESKTSVAAEIVVTIKTSEISVSVVWRIRPE